MNMKNELVEKLKKDILLWQGYQVTTVNQGEAIGLGAIESAFPNGVFPKKGIHEFITLTPEHAAASDGFIGGLLSILMKDGAACVWISTARKLFPLSLKMFNVEPERIIFMDVTKEKDALWIMEEALKCEGLAVVVAELNSLSLIESRRLQLASEQSGVTGFILRKEARKALNSIATARWQITALPSETEDAMPGIGFPRWNVELSKVRNGNPGSWTMEWRGDCFAAISIQQKITGQLDQEERKLG